MSYRRLSLTKKLALLILTASMVSGLSFLIMQAISDEWIDRHLESETYFEQQSSEYVKKFAEYVDANGLSSTDRDAFAAWTKKEKIILLTIYKDQVLQFDSVYTAGDESAYGVESESQYAKKHSSPVLFSDGQGDVIIDGFFASRYYDAAFALEVLASTAIFLSIVLTGIRRSLAYLKTIHEEIHILEGGDLEYAMTIRGHDELAMIAGSIEELRKAFLGKLLAIEALQAESRSLVTEMSHDMRTPLTSLMMYLEFARKEKDKLSPEASSYITNAYGKALQLKSLSDNLFAYFLLDKEQEAELETLSAQEAIYDLMSDLVGVLRQEQFLTRLTGELPDAYITVNMEYLGRVFDNLLSNLLKYAELHDEINISFVFDQEVFEIHIRNTIKATDASLESTRLGEKIIAKMMQHMLGQFSSSNDGLTYRTVLRFWNTKRY
ncbi:MULTISPECIES: HAMP domain-containing sensor histidine kinase [Paenibacillus]|uniref:HAMP domain-containing sensor histidine kinase n=1 Tax=Paenibacillus TaxID=44249 RepID=UPI0022B8CD58|nr:HAMP domain-containing sensor histidine kinase [Paenibacillus caseinilyticus]MCZ8517855.1 HAMP domain-containing sensor histidine kinase [Paenibacillus caseinilyticus]